MDVFNNCTEIKTKLVNNFKKLAATQLEEKCKSLKTDVAQLRNTDVPKA